MVTKKVYDSCIAEVEDWVDVPGMQAQLMKYGIIQTQDDIYGVTHGPPGERRNFLYNKCCRLKNGFSLLYHCLRESQESLMGHKDVANALEERGVCLCVQVLSRKNVFGGEGR